MGRDQEARRIAEAQHGVLSRAQLFELGADYSFIHRKCRSGFLHELLAGVYSIGGVPESVKQKIMSVVLALPNAVASHRCAAALLHMRGFVLGTIEVTSSSCGCSDLNGLAVVHRSMYLCDDDVVVVDGIPATRPARTLFDLGAALGAGELRRVILDSVADRLVTEPQLWAQVREGPHRGRPGAANFKKALAQIGIGDEESASWLEDRAFARIAEAGFELPERQFDVQGPDGFIARVDLAYPQQRLVVEVDGWDFHCTRSDFVRDRQRQNELVAAGWSVLRFTNEDAAHPRHFTRRLAEAEVPRTINESFFVTS